MTTGFVRSYIEGMKFLLLVYIDPELVGTLPAQEYDAEMRTCLAHADDLQRDGQPDRVAAARAAVHRRRSVRVRNGRQTVHDGPFAETKELLGGFNLIEAADIDEAVRIAASFPWTKVGCIEVRPVHDIDAERRRVGARKSA